MTSERMVSVVGAVAYELDPLPRLMLFRRASHLRGAGSWEFPGGKIEAGESEVEALQRELYEELSVQIKVEDRIGESVLGGLRLSAYFIKILDPKNMVLKDHDQFCWVTAQSWQELAVAGPDTPLIQLAFHMLSRG